MENMQDFKVCEKCSGRTALISGQWYYEPDEEPYESGKHEKALVEAGDAYIHGFKCDSCGHIQGCWED